MPRHTQAARPRIVSLAPSVTSTLLAIGARHDLVGVSKWCKDVVPVAGLPQVGDCWKLDIHEVMRLRPTLLIGSVPFATETVAKLIAQPVAFLALNPRGLADIEGNIRTLGRLVNRVAAAEELIAQMRSVFTGLAHRGARELRSKSPDSRRRAAAPTKKKYAPLKAPDSQRPRVYCEAWPNPRISSPPWVAELVSIAGGEFVTTPGKRLTDSDVALAKPDLIVLAWTATGIRADASRALCNRAWQDTRAVRNRRVVVIADQLLNTPGPPLMQGARALFRAIHSAP